MIAKISETLQRLFIQFKDEEGQALAEYGLILGLIAVVAIAALTLLGTAVSGQLGTISSALGGGGSS